MFFETKFIFFIHCIKKNRNRSLKNFMLLKFDNVMLQFKIDKI